MMNGAAIPVRAENRSRVKTLSISLANSTGVYRPGDKIVGTVVLELTEDTPVYCKLHIVVIYSSNLLYSQTLVQRSPLFRISRHRPFLILMILLSVLFSGLHCLGFVRASDFDTYKRMFPLIRYTLTTLYSITHDPKTNSH